MRILQNLWSKRCSTDDRPTLICRSSKAEPVQDFTDCDETCHERSFFESDSESEDEDTYEKP